MKRTHIDPPTTTKCHGFNLAGTQSTTMCDCLILSVTLYILILLSLSFLSPLCCTYSTSTDRYANVDVGVLLYHIERFPGIIILTTNLIENIDRAFFRRLRFVLHFETPSAKLRAKLWQVK